MGKCSKIDHPEFAAQRLSSTDLWRQRPRRSTGCAPASRLLSLNLQRLSQDWLDRFGHPIALVETFVDPERFEGTCYRAANWTEIGKKAYGYRNIERLKTDILHLGGLDLYLGQ